jgi:hypothetical protein
MVVGKNERGRLFYFSENKSKSPITVSRELEFRVKTFLKGLRGSRGQSPIVAVRRQRNPTK